MKVDWQEIDGEYYFNDPVHGWLKKLPRDETPVPFEALFTSVHDSLGWDRTTEPGVLMQNTYWLFEYVVPCDPPCTLTPQVSLDVCLEYVGYKVSKATKGMQPEVKEAFLQKVYALKQTFALEVDKLLNEVKHG